MSVKMKGLMKGLRYISQIFDEEEKEQEIQIGYPTDVKHVAHIGWDGPSASAPSWMNEFKSGNEAPEANGDAKSRDIDHLKGSSQDATQKFGVRDSPGRDLPSIPKSSRRQPSVESMGSLDSSPPGSPTKKSGKSSRRRSKQKESTSPRAGDSSTSQELPNMPKKSRRKKSKDPEGSHKKSSKSKDKGSRHGGSRHGSDDGSVSQHLAIEPCPS